MKINTKTWFDGVRICKKDEEYLGSAEKGHFREVVGAEIEEYKDTSLEKAIRNALLAMDHENDKIWTNAGLPQVKEVEKMLGHTISRDQITEAFPGFERDVKALGKEKTILPAAK